MSRRRGILSGLVATATALLLVACAGLPTSGDVQQGLEAGQDAGPPDISFIPDSPQPGATPVQIVEGFMRAGLGTADNWARAQEFLAPQFRSVWDPQAGVAIDILGSRTPSELDEDSVGVSIAQVAKVDDKGSYEWFPQEATSLSFELGRVDGEWRITKAPDGIVIDRSLFASVFQAYPLAYFDPDWQYLVPDVRWFPTTNAATRIADALVNKPPSEWLEASVATAFPEGVAADVAVPVASGVAAVSLSADAVQLDQQTLDRMQTQLEASLGAARVGAVEMLVDNAVLAAEPVATRGTTVTGSPLVQVEEGFGFLAGEELTPIPGLSTAMRDVDPVAVQITPDRDTAATLVADGTVVRVQADGTVSPVDDRPGLIAPTVDPFGIIWTAPREDPQAVLVQSPGLAPIELDDAWPDATHIWAMAVSRDGTRVAAVVTLGGSTAVWISAVVRNTDDAPARLSEPLALGVVSGAALDLAWLDDATVGVLFADGAMTSVLTQPIGGPGVVAAGPEGAVAIAGGASASSVRLRGQDGDLYIKRGANWSGIASGVSVLATQQGMPQ